MLIECYNNLKSKGKKIEIIFVSLDKDEASFDSYYKDMPWLTIGFGSDQKVGCSSVHQWVSVSQLVPLCVRKKATG